MSATSSVTRSIAAVFGSNLTTSILAAAGGLLVARFVGPDDLGRFRAFTIPLTYLTLLHAGTFDGLWRQVPLYFGRGLAPRAEALASAAGAWNVRVSIVVSLGFLACALFSAVRGDAHGVVGWLSQAVAAWGVFYAGYLGATYRTIHQFTTLARLGVIQALIGFALVAITPFLTFFGLCIRTAVTALAGVVLLHSHRPMRIPYRFRGPDLREVVRVGLPFSIWGAMYTSVWTATEGVLILSLEGATALGLFSAAVALREAMNALPAAAHQVMSPRIVEAFAAEGSVRQSWRRTVVPTLWLCATVVAAVLLASIALDSLVPLAIPRYVLGLALMKLCLWFAVVQAASLPLNTFLATGNAGASGRGIALGLVAFGLATYLLLPVLGGMLAVAAGSLIGRWTRTLEAYAEIALLTRAEIGGADVSRR